MLKTHKPPTSTSNYLQANSSETLPHDDQIISCEICLKSVPVSEADFTEAEEYIAYFCGLECYDIWRHTKSTDPS